MEVGLGWGSKTGLDLGPRITWRVDCERHLHKIGLNNKLEYDRV